MASSSTAAPAKPGLVRVLGLWSLVIYGIVLVQPTAPMSPFGVVSVKAEGHVVTTLLIGMVAMLFTAISYGRMAALYPTAGSAYAYVGHTIHPALGYVTGWSMLFDYVMNPIICVIWCSKAAANFLPLPFPVWATFFALLFTFLNLQGVKTSARTNAVIAGGLGFVIVLFLFYAFRYLSGVPLDGAALARPFYDPATFSWDKVSTGTSLAVLTYIGFDGISTLSEEVKNPRRNILLATVLVCLFTGLAGSLQVYLAQLIWPDWSSYPDVDTAFVHVAGRAGGPILFAILNLALLVANVGSGMGAHLGASRLLYGMGRDNAIPRRFFGAVNPQDARAEQQRHPRRRHRPRGRLHRQLRPGGRAAQLRGLHRLHGREPLRAPPLLVAGGEEDRPQPAAAAPRVPDLRLSLVEPQLARSDRRLRVARDGRRLRRLEDAGLPEADRVPRSRTTKAAR